MRTASQPARLDPLRDSTFRGDVQDATYGVYVAASEAPISK